MVKFRESAEKIKNKVKEILFAVGENELVRESMKSFRKGVKAGAVVSITMFSRPSPSNADIDLSNPPTEYDCEGWQDLEYLRTQEGYTSIQNFYRKIKIDPEDYSIPENVRLYRKEQWCRKKMNEILERSRPIAVNVGNQPWFREKVVKIAAYISGAGISIYIIYYFRESTLVIKSIAVCQKVKNLFLKDPEEK